MSILTTIDGIPLFSSVPEAMSWAALNGKQGYHTHVYQGQIGFMGGETHSAATTSSQGLNGSNQNIESNNNNNNNNNFNSGY